MAKQCAETVFDQPHRGALNRLRWGGPTTYTLPTVGRRTGTRRSTPVALAIRGGARYLVAPYGEVGWVHNIRASSTGTLSRRGRDEQISIQELEADEAAPVLAKYYQDVEIVRPCFDVTNGAGLDAFRAAAGRHPVLRIKDGERG